jgi:hypothetical protein
VKREAEVAHCADGDANKGIDVVCGAGGGVRAACGAATVSEVLAIENR